MTKTTEELKRVMHVDLKRLGQTSGAHLYRTFEESLEEYLEALRKDLKTAHIATGDVAIQLSEMKTERDELRNKLQAFEFANKNAGELLRDALATVKRQRQYIRTLYTSRKARKVAGSTSGQKKAESSLETKCRASGVIPACSFEGMHKHYTGTCPHCGSGTL